MRWIVRALIANLIALALTAPGLAEPGLCGGEIPCPVGERRYRAALPEGWDGVRPLPVVLHFHGWGRQGAGVLTNPRIAGAVAEAGALLIAPDGLGKSWDFWRDTSRDVPFVEAVLADAARRWPIDRSRIVISGFSYGAAMVLRLACAKGEAYAAYLPIAGTLWRQDEQDCVGPARVLAVHGLTDTVMDLPRGPGGEVAAGVALWRRMNMVAEPPEVSQLGAYACHSWVGQAPVRLCTHPGGHWIPRDWLGLVLPDVLGDQDLGD
ncbi:MAG: polyhydroxybutyrate depolymerase [Pseudomonadota bacterium]